MTLDASFFLAAASSNFNVKIISCSNPLEGWITISYTKPFKSPIDSHCIEVSSWKSEIPSSEVKFSILTSGFPYKSHLDLTIILGFVFGISPIT